MATNKMLVQKESEMCYMLFGRASESIYMILFWKHNYSLILLIWKNKANGIVFSYLEVAFQILGPVINCKNSTCTCKV